jgi:superfamily II DNA/RNA helicase
LPYAAEDYIHRIGRTGRAGASGVALSLMTGDDDRLLAEIEKLLKRKLPVERLEVDTGASARPRRDRDSERRPERESADRPARASADRDRGTRRSPARDASRAGSAGSTPGYSNDAFFFQPYQAAPEPEAPAGEAAKSPGEAEAGRSGARRRPARALPALLGGKKS